MAVERQRSKRPCANTYCLHGNRKPGRLSGPEEVALWGLGAFRAQQSILLGDKGHRVEKQPRTCSSPNPSFPTYRQHGPWSSPKGLHSV